MGKMCDMVHLTPFPPPHPYIQSADMMNFLLTPAAIKAEDNKYTPSKHTTMQTKIPQTAAVEHSKETFNDKTRKSLLKINLFIRRLKWFNIFTDATTTATTTTTTTATTKAQKSTTEINQKW